jgi:hypothetical protein
MPCRYCLSPSGCLATGWFVDGCFAAVVFVGGCFATVVVGLLSGRCFAAESDLALPRYRCFAVVGVFASSTANAWPLVGSLADTLSSVGSLADALPPLLLDGLLCRRPLQCCIFSLTGSARRF